MGVGTCRRSESEFYSRSCLAPYTNTLITTNIESHQLDLSLTTMAAAYFFTSPIDVEIKLEGEELRKKVDMKLEKEKSVSCPVYYDGESVAGQVSLHAF